MQTFVPEPTYAASASALDWRRLGKQRAEVLQMAYTIMDPTYAKGRWANHTAVNMWRGHGAAMLTYGLVVCVEWRSRGYRDTCLDKMAVLLPAMVALGERIERPPWWGDMSVHDSHKGRLFSKDPTAYERYYEFMGVDTYVWPEGRPRKITKSS